MNKSLKVVELIVAVAITSTTEGYNRIGFPISVSGKWQLCLDHPEGRGIEWHKSPSFQGVNEFSFRSYLLQVKLHNWNVSLGYLSDRHDSPSFIPLVYNYINNKDLENI
jgi:hypothetical protein